MNTTKNKVAIASIVLLIIITAITFYVMLQQYHDNNKWVNHTQEVIETLQKVETDISAAESEGRAFMLSGNSFHSDAYKSRAEKIYSEIDDVQRLTRDNQGQQANIILLKQVVNDRLADLRLKIEHRKVYGVDSFLIGATRSGSDYMQQVELAIRKMKDEESRLLVVRNEKVEGSRSLAIIIIVLSTIINLTVVTFLIIRNGRMYKQTRVAQLKLMKSYRQIVDLNRQKNYLLGTAAHDLRNPIANITQICELMFPEIEPKISKADFEFLKNIEVSSKYLSNLLNDLLDVARIESGKLTLNKTAVQLDGYLTTIWKMNKIAADKKGIQLLYVNEAGNEFTLSIDAVKLEQVINNLIGNAIKFSLPNTTITLRLSREGGKVRIGVRDEGPGIPEGEQHKLFKAFQRTSVRTTGGEKSTGLGLMISSNIVREHGSELRVNSKPGNGSEFFFDLSAEVGV